MGNEYYKDISYLKHKCSISSNFNFNFDILLGGNCPFLLSH